MRTILKLSDAAIIGLHAVSLLGREPLRRRCAAEMAEELGVSCNHLSKVMQRLTRAGLVAPSRGPNGGFALAERAGGAKLRDIIVAIEGSLEFAGCLMESSVCGRDSCPFSELLADTNKRLEKILSQKVSAFVKNG